MAVATQASPQGTWELHTRPAAPALRGLVGYYQGYSERTGGPLRRFEHEREPTDPLPGPALPRRPRRHRLAGACPGDAAGPGRLELPAGGESVYVALDSAEQVDELFASATEIGADVLMPVTDQPYGSHEFTVADPEGNAWSVGTYRPG